MDLLWVYVRAVLLHWQAYFTGGGVMVALAIWERFVRPISRRAFYWLVVVSFMVAASFMAWKDAYTSMKGREADLHKAELAVIGLKVEVEDLQQRPRSNEKLMDRKTCNQLATYMVEGRKLLDAHKVGTERSDTATASIATLKLNLQGWEAAVSDYLGKNLGAVQTERFLHPTALGLYAMDGVPAELEKSWNVTMFRIQVLESIALQGRC